MTVMSLFNSLGVCVKVLPIVKYVLLMQNWEVGNLAQLLYEIKKGAEQMTFINSYILILVPKI